MKSEAGHRKTCSERVRLSCVALRSFTKRQDIFSTFSTHLISMSRNRTYCLQSDLIRHTTKILRTKYILACRITRITPRRIVTEREATHEKRIREARGSANQHPASACFTLPILPTGKFVSPETTILNECHSFALYLLG